MEENMLRFQDVVVAALFSLVVTCVIAKFLLVALYEGDHNETMIKVDANSNKGVKVVEHVNLGDALKVKVSRSKKKVKFVDDVLVRHVDQLGFDKKSHEIGEEIKRVVFSVEKDEIFKCFDKKKVDEDGNLLLCSDELNEGLFDESSERVIIDQGNAIANLDRHLILVEKNVIVRPNSEILKGDYEQWVKDDEKMVNTIEASQLGFISYGEPSCNVDESVCVKEGNLKVEGMDELTIEEKIIKEETSTSGSVSNGLMVDEKINDEGLSSESSVGFKREHATLKSDDVNLVARLVENMGGGMSDRDEKEDQVQPQGEDVEGGLNKKYTERVIKNENVVIDEEDDDWEGIERTELEKVFAEAVNYLEFGLKGKDDELAKLGSDVQMQFYGLHKIAVEGSCHQAQPMALNFFARAKWNAWQKLGSMSPEVAMEEYIKLLTEHFPEWVQHFYDEDGEQNSVERGIAHDAEHRCPLQDTPPKLLPESDLNVGCVTEIDSSIGTKLDKD